MKLLRHNVVTRNDLEKLKKKGVDDLDSVLKDLFEWKMIFVFEDKNGVENYCLLSDFHVSKYFPRYTIDKIKNSYINKTKNPQVLTKALSLIRDEYMHEYFGKSEVKERKNQETDLEIDLIGQ